MRTMSARELVFFGLGVTLLAAPPAIGGSWTSLGPPGGPVTRVVVSGGAGAVSFATRFGLWVRLGDATIVRRTVPGVDEIEALVADRYDPLRVWVLGTTGPPGSSTQLIETSDDGGGTWSVPGSITGLPPVHAAVADPAIPGALVIDLAAPSRAVVRLRADGTVETLAAFGAPAVLAAGPAGRLYAAPAWGAVGLYRSDDDGSSWTRVSDERLDPAVLAVDPDDAGRLLAGSTSGLMISTDGGRSWRETAVKGSVRGIAFNPAAPVVVWCATSDKLWLSRNGGLFWQVVWEHGPGLEGVAADPEDPATVYVAAALASRSAGRSGLYRSSDFGRTLVPADGGAPATPVRRLIPGPADVPRLLLESGSNAPWLWDGASRTWRRLWPNGDEPEVSAVGVDPGDPDRLFAASFVWGDFGYGDALFVSEDGGAGWTRRTLPVTRAWFEQLVGDRYSSDRVFGASRFGVVVFDLLQNDWELTTEAPNSVETVAPLPASPGVVLAGGAEIGLLRSTDDGESWQTVAGFPPEQGWGWRLAAAQAGPVYLLIPHRGLFRSDDAGASWQTRDEALPAWCTDVAVSPRSADEVLLACPEAAASTSDWGVRWSLDGGRHWRAVPGPGGLRANSVAFDPVHPGHVFVGTDEAGVWDVQLPPMPRRSASRTARTARPVAGAVRAVALRCHREEPGAARRRGDP